MNIKNLLVDQNILIGQSVSNWEEAIELVSAPLLKSKAINESYVKAMVDSVNEFGPYIVISKHLALAHARPEDGAFKLGLSVATLNPSIKFGNEINDPVKIIFCLSTPDNKSHLEALTELINLINDENKLELLIKSQSKEEFRKILF